MATRFTKINILGSIRATSSGTPPPPPPANYDQYTVMQLPGTGTNNTNNNLFIDSSSNNFAITRYGNTTQGSFSPFSTAPGYWSNYFDGNGDWLTIPSSSAFSIPTSTTPFTIEAWVYPTANGGAIFSEQFTGEPNSVAITLTLCNGVQIFETIGLIPAFGYYKSGAAGGVGWVTAAMANTAIGLNQWSHVAAVFTGSTTRIYINGNDVTKSSNPTPATTWDATGDNGNEWYVGRRWDSFYAPFFTGNISNFRFVKGTAVYTSNFTPSTTPLTAVSGTSLLTCQSNRFIDNSSNNFAITRNGDTSVSAFGPFAPSSSYSAATMGGSMYFDGSGDGLSRSINSTTDGMYPQGTTYTIECWIYLPDATVGYIYNTAAFNDNYFGCYLIYTNGSSISLNYRSNTGLQFPSTELTFTPSTPFVGSWTHIVISVLNGAVKCFVNGVQAGSTQSIPAMAFTPVAAGFGPWANGYNTPSGNFYGYISNFRIVQGSAVYTTNFTPPTAPVTAISGTSLLLNGTNGAIYDASTKNVLETVGDAKVSTTVSANGSIYFDGNGDYLLAPSNDTQQLGSGNFTIEMWMQSSSGGVLLTKDNNEFVNYGNLFLSVGPTVYFHCNPNPNSETGRVVLTSTSTVTTNNWVHIAVSRTGNNWYLFVNGILESTASSGVGFWNTSSPFYVGCALTRSSPAGFYQGYINNLRITKGIGRYTGNFTPPARS